MKSIYLGTIDILNLTAFLKAMANGIYPVTSRVLKNLSQIEHCHTASRWHFKYIQREATTPETVGPKKSKALTLFHNSCDSSNLMIS